MPTGSTHLFVAESHLNKRDSVFKLFVDDMVLLSNSPRPVFAQIVFKRFRLPYSFEWRLLNVLNQ